MLGYQDRGPTVPGMGCNSGWALLRVEPETRCRNRGISGSPKGTVGRASRSQQLGTLFRTDHWSLDGNALPEMGMNLHIPCWSVTLSGSESSLLLRTLGA